MSETGGEIPQNRGGIPEEIFKAGGFAGEITGLSGKEKLFCVVNPVYINIEDSNDDNLAFQASIEDGTLSLDVNNKIAQGSSLKHPDIYPSRLLEQTFKYFTEQGQKIERIKGLWGSGKDLSSGEQVMDPSDNYIQYMAYLSKFEPEEITEEIKREAALQTWTGKQAQKYGYSEVASIKVQPIEQEFDEEAIEIIFAKPQNDTDERVSA